MQEPTVGIVILVYNDYENTKECLETLKKIDYRNYQIVIVDNGSTDGCCEKLATEFPNIKVLKREKNQGAPAGNNEGLKYFCNKNFNYCLILNSDTVVEESFLRNLIEGAQKDKKYGVIGPVIYFYNRPYEIQSAGGRFTFFQANFPLVREIKKDIQEVDFLSGTCMLIRKEVLDKVGFWGEDYFIYMEDVDFCYRVKKEGYKIICLKDAKIYHKGGMSAKNLGILKLFYHFVRSRIIWGLRYLKIYQFLPYLMSLPFVCLLRCFYLSKIFYKR